MRTPTGPLLALLACVGARAAADSPAGPTAWIRRGSVTDLAVGETLRVYVESLETGKPVAAKTTWALDPADVATIASDGTLTAIAPGVVEISAKVTGDQPLVPEFLTVRRSIPGGRLPQIRGVEGPVDFELRMTAPDDGLPAMVMFATWAKQSITPQTLGITLAGLPRGSLPFTHEARIARYGPFTDREKNETKPAKAIVRIDTIREGAVSGAVDLTAEAGTKVHLDFVAGVPDGGYLASAAVDASPIAPARGSALRGLRVSPRGLRPDVGLVLLHDGRGLDDALRNQGNVWAAEGYEVVVVDLFGGETSEGDESPRGRRLAAAVDPERADLAVDEAIALLEKGPAGATRRVGVVGWGIGADFALRAAARHSELATCVLLYGGSAADLFRDWTTPTRVFALFGESDLRPPREAVDAFRERLGRSAAAHEVHVEKASGEAVASPYWLFGYGPPATRKLHGRLRTFVHDAVQ